MLDFLSLSENPVAGDPAVLAGNIGGRNACFTVSGDGGADGVRRSGFGCHGAPDQSSAGVVEEILVTSRRVSESIQDVPVAVTAFTERELDRVAPRTLKDLDGLSPNVFIGQQTAGPSMGAIFIRGIGYADVDKTQSAQVGVIIDGIFQGTNTGQIIDMFDVERVEITPTAARLSSSGSSRR
jgi:outer membrane receptor protein involved in Fe transport